MAVLGLALIVLPTLLSRLVGVAPEALRAVAFALLAFGTIVEYVVWTIGLGAAAMTGLGRWATAPPPLPAPADPPSGSEQRARAGRARMTAALGPRVGVPGRCSRVWSRLAPDGAASRARRADGRAWMVGYAVSPPADRDQ